MFSFTALTREILFLPCNILITDFVKMKWLNLVFTRLISVRIEMAPVSQRTAFVIDNASRFILKMNQTVSLVAQFYSAFYKSFHKVRLKFPKLA